MECREGCGACCIAPSISSSIPGMPGGKAAGERCVQLDEKNRCKVFSSPLRPRVCEEFQPCTDVCGSSSVEALENLLVLQQLSDT